MKILFPCVTANLLYTKIIFSTQSPVHNQSSSSSLTEFLFNRRDFNTSGPKKQKVLVKNLKSFYNSSLNFANLVKTSAAFSLVFKRFLFGERFVIFLSFFVIFFWLLFLQWFLKFALQIVCAVRDFFINLSRREGLFWSFFNCLLWDNVCVPPAWSSNVLLGSFVSPVLTNLFPSLSLSLSLSLHLKTKKMLRKNA